jgi:signal transduction histidine kinase
VQSERLVRLSGMARKSDLLRSTLTLAHALEHCRNLGESLAELHLSLKKLMYAENFFVVMLDTSRQNLVFEYYVDLFDDDTSPIPFREGSLSGSLSAAVVAAGTVLRGSTRELLQRSGHVDTLHDHEYGYGPSASDWLGVPMMVANQALGAVVVQSYDPTIRFNDSDPSMLSMVAEAIAAALHRRHVRAELEQTVAERTAQFEQANRSLHETVNKLERAIGQLVQTEKLSSLGSMVAGISHELNTPIGTALTVATTIEARLNSLAEKVASGSLTRKALDEFVTSGLDMIRLVETSTQRAAALVSSFKQVAIDQTSENRRMFVVHQVAQDLLTAMNPVLICPTVVVSNAIPAGLVCDSYPGPLAQVLANLVQNALTHAFGNGEAGAICIDAHSRGDHLVVTVTDNGVGMTSHEQAHAFDPFFTTKLGRGGSGIGLAVCHRIVSSVLGGEMKLTSAPGKGASFALDIPMTAPGRI